MTDDTWSVSCVSKQKMEVKPEENTGVQVLEASHADNIGEEEHDSVGSSRPVPVLPPEIWARIFEFCSTRNDVIAVMTTCKQWNRLASSKKTTVLLPLVLPFVIEHLQKDDILACRRINKDSKNVVDNTLAKVWNCSNETYKTQLENPRRRHWDKLIREIDEIHFKYFLYMIEEMVELRSCLDLDNQTDPEYNPFLLRSIRTITCCAGCDPPTGSVFDEVDREYRALHALVSEYGKHVWTFNVHLVNAGRPQFLRQGIVKLFTYLMDLPNLKTLVISIRDVDPLGGTALSDFVEGCTQLLVPKLEKLVHLNVIEIKADILATELIQHYKNQLTTFKCHGRWFETVDCIQELKSLFPNLTTLVVDNGDDELSSCTLNKVAQVNWPLQVLEISSTGLISLEGVEAVDVLRAVCNFRETLIELELYLDMLMIDWEKSDICDTNNCKFQVFPKLNKLTTWWENTDVYWFWNWVQCACMQVQEIVFWSDQFTNIEREAAKAMFGKMSKLQKVVFLYDPEPDPDNENDQRPALKATVSRPSTT